MFPERKERKWFKPYSPEWRITMDLLKLALIAAKKYEDTRPYESLKVGKAIILEIPKDPIKRSGTKALEMHLTPGTILFPGDNFIDYVRGFRLRTNESLRALANLCERNSSVLNGVEEFYGISHLASQTAERTGFSIENVPFAKRWPYEIKCRIDLWITVGMNKGWRNMKAKYTTPKKASIARSRLVELYGSGLKTTNS